MEYWHDIMTEKSWKMLQKIKGEFNFILIGGWATYLYTRAMKSKDIDIIIDFSTLSELKKKYDVRKNNILKKYEMRIESVDIDIYVKFYSKLIPAPEKIETEKIEGFTVPIEEHLLILKQAAEQERKESEKGEKDRIDIMSLLLKCDVDFKKYYKILEEEKKEGMRKNLISLVRNFTEYKYVGLSPRELKLKKNKLIEQLRKK